MLHTVHWHFMSNWPESFHTFSVWCRLSFLRITILFILIRNSKNPFTNFTEQSIEFRLKWAQWIICCVSAAYVNKRITNNTCPTYIFLAFGSFINSCTIASAAAAAVAADVLCPFHLIQIQIDQKYFHNFHLMCFIRNKRKTNGIPFQWKQISWKTKPF